LTFHAHLNSELCEYNLVMYRRCWCAVLQAILTEQSSPLGQQNDNDQIVIFESFF